MQVNDLAGGGLVQHHRLGGFGGTPGKACDVFGAGLLAGSRQLRVELRLQHCGSRPSFFGQLLVNRGLFPRPTRHVAFLGGLCFEQARHFNLVRLRGLGILQLGAQLRNLLLEIHQALAGIIRQLEGAGFEAWLVAETAMKPDRDLACDLKCFDAFAVADAVISLVRSQVAGAAQHVEQLANLGVHAQTCVDSAKQFSLRGLRKLHTQSGSDVLRDGFSQQPKLEHATRGVERK